MESKLSVGSLKLPEESAQIHFFHFFHSDLTAGEILPILKQFESENAIYLFIFSNAVINLFNLTTELRKRKRNFDSGATIAFSSIPGLSGARFFSFFKID